MDPEQTKIRLDVNEWDIKLQDRNRDRMKLTIKLSKDEAQSFKNFSDVCKPQDISDADFLRTVFITGIEGMNNQLTELVRKYASENKDELASSGITVFEDADGDVRLADTELLASEVSGAPSDEPVKWKSVVDNN